MGDKGWGDGRFSGRVEMGDKGWGDGRLVVEWRWEIRGGVMED